MTIWQRATKGVDEVLSVLLQLSSHLLPYIQLLFSHIVSLAVEYKFFDEWFF